MALAKLAKSMTTASTVDLLLVLLLLAGSATTGLLQGGKVLLLQFRQLRVQARLVEVVGGRTAHSSSASSSATTSRSTTKFRQIIR